MDSEDEGVVNEDVGPLYEEEVNAIETGFSADEANWLDNRFARVSRVREEHMREMHSRFEAMSSRIEEIEQAGSRTTMNFTILHDKVIAIEEEIRKLPALDVALEERVQRRMQSQVRNIEDALESVAN